MRVVDHAQARAWSVHDAPFPAEGRFAVRIGEATVTTLDLRAFECVGVVTTLTPFEARYLADNRRPFRVALRIPPRGVVRTDLHTHFAGCPRAEDLIRLGLERGIVFPPEALRRAGVHVDRAIALTDMGAPLRRRVAQAMHIPLDRQATYREMQSVYRVRQPLTKPIDMFAPLLWQIAKDYASAGVDYAELSLHQILEPERLAIADTELPRIRAATGVTLRFLASFGRHDDATWIAHYLGRLLDMSDHEAIVGVDVVGHETNSTHAFGPLLGRFALAVAEVRSDFVVRVHAGENPSHPENIGAAVDYLRGAAVQLRIGHGVHGVGSATLAGLRELGAIVEFNLSSNFALNNVQSFDEDEVPIRRYLEAGVDVVLGSDGYGIYRTEAALEAAAALACGIDDDALGQIREAESRYLDKRDRDAARLASSRTAPRTTLGADFEAVALTANRAIGANRSTAREAIEQRLQSLGVSLLPRDSLHALLRRRQVVSVAGAWKVSWARLSEDERQRITSVLDALIEQWSPDDTVLLVGGTRHGVEAVAGSLARARGITVVGTVVLGHEVTDFDSGLLSHAAILGSSIYDKCDALYRLVKEHDGWCLFFAGGIAVGDEIQTARNLCLRRLLYAAAGGASATHAREKPSHAFTTAEEAHRAMTSARRVGRLYHAGANPAADIAVFRRSGDRLLVLLIRRLDQVNAEPGRWSLPGGFIDTDAEPGTPWRAGRESPREAAVRELREETGLDISEHAERLAFVGDFEGGGRDPRDSALSWVRSSAFATLLAGHEGDEVVVGCDDAIETRWVPLTELPPLAFDHDLVVRRAMAACGLDP